jgi:hypothetical protein
MAMSTLPIGAGACAEGLHGALQAVGAGAKPVILFAAPSELGHGLVDLDYLKQLHGEGFEVDYTESLDELTWERIRRFNVLVIFGAPGGFSFLGELRGEKLTREAFATLLERYVAAGGGVLLLAAPAYTRREVLPGELMRRWGFRLAAERLKESNSANSGTLSRMDVPMLYTRQVSPSPISEGVTGIWYPNQYRGSPDWASMTNPIWVSDAWRVVVRASPTTTAERIDFARATQPLPDPYFYPDGARQSPPLFAIRDYQKGRLALVSQYPQFSVGAGTKWFYNSEVLEHGIGDRPSAFGRLLVNTFRWLARDAPGLGGHVTDLERLEAPNYRPAVIRAAVASSMQQGTNLDDYRQVPPGVMTRGLFGARTSRSSGRNTVAEYAAAARRLGLGFVVFLEEFSELTTAKLESLKADCRQYSGDGLKLVGGYTIATNIGNSMFLYGPEITMPPAKVLSGPGATPGSTVFRQQQFEEGSLSSLEWLLQISVESRNMNQIGYYNFKEAAARGGMRLSNAKMYSMAALRYYKGGRQVEDLTHEYLATAGSTIPPTPVSLNEVSSVEEMEREVQSGHALTYARVSSLEKLYDEALRYSHQYDSLRVFVSDGPLIEAWAGVHRVDTYGGQEFVTNAMLMPALIAVSSSIGLKEIDIFNGSRLYRRFLPGGAKEFKQLLILEGAVQKNLVLAVEDTKGGRAVSYARRSWKGGSGGEVTFCSDRINDCKSPSDGPVLLAHGPYNVPVTSVAQVPNPGYTWDGGPASARALAAFEQSTPLLHSDVGEEIGGNFEQTPLLEFTDEGAAAVKSVRERVFDGRIPNYNPWWAWGPTTPAKLMNYTSRYRQWNLPTLGPAQVGWYGTGVRTGIQPTLHRCELTFLRPQTIRTLVLLSSSSAPFRKAFLVIGHKDAAPETIEAGALEEEKKVLIATGDWFGAYTPEIGNSHLFINRGQPFWIRAANPRGGGNWLQVAALLEGKTVRAGQGYTLELFAVNYPLESAAKSTSDLVRLRTYLASPDGLKLIRGTRVAGDGILELEPRDGAVELQLSRPDRLPRLTLPVRVAGMNARWSVWLWQKKGYEKGDYGNGIDRYTPLGVDDFGNAYVPAHTTWAGLTHLAAGHPVVADAGGAELFIQVTALPRIAEGEKGVRAARGEQPVRWHVSVNNPTDRVIKTTLRRAMELPGLNFCEKTVTLAPDAYQNLE